MTFNYDTLIERSLVYGWPINQMSDFVGPHPYKLIKLHGSTSWGRRVTLPEHAREEVMRNVHPQALIKAAPQWQLTDQYYYSPSAPPDYRTPDLFVPAIAIPTIQKAMFECPPEHLASLEERIPDVDRILTIGWRASELHFLKLLRDGLKKQPLVQAVSGSTTDAMRTLQNLQAAGIAFSKSEPYGGGFSAFVRDSGVRQLLNWATKRQE
ncbi:MAG: hypothetical protein JWL61_4180 [Gemmatimonadetes bacterium]|nr:hypothetical protein [Gemmatimonadota bacterium]